MRQRYIWNIRLTRRCRRRDFCIILKDGCKLARYQIYVVNVAGGQIEFSKTAQPEPHAKILAMAQWTQAFESVARDIFLAD